MLKVLVVTLAGQMNAGPPPPSDAAVLRALRPGMPNLPFFHESHRQDVTVVTTRACLDRVVIILPGWAAGVLEVAHWTCEVHYTEMVRSVYPLPVKLKAKRVQSVWLATARLVR